MIESARTRLGYPRRGDLAGAADGGVAVPHHQPGAVHQRRRVRRLDLWHRPVGRCSWSAAVALAVAISLGSVGLPGQVSFMATNMPVTQAMGLPVEPLGVLLAIDTIPDVFATVGNVTADLTATSVVARRTPPSE